jgi:tetratricopeptide (TPR) repeat protein
MLTEVADETLAQEPRMEKKRRALLEQALALYQEFLHDKSADLEVQKKTGLAYKRVADLQRLLGHLDQAEGSYTQAIALLEKLSAELPEQVEYRHLLADSLNWQGELQRLASRSEEAVASLERARGLQENLAQQHADQPAYRKDLARTHMNLGLVRGSVGRPDEAIVSFRAAIAILDDLAAQHARAASFQQELARCLLNLGPVLRLAGKETEAEATYDRAVSILEQLQEQAPRHPDYRFELAMVLHNRANFHAQRKGENGASHLGRAEADLGRARKLFENLVADFPSVPIYRHEQANLHNSLGDVRVRRKDLPGAAEAWNQTRGSLEILLGEFPETARFRGDLGMVLGNLGWLRGKQEEWPQSRDLLLKAIPQVQEGLRPNPNNPDFLRALRNIHRDLANAYLHLEDHAAAARTAQLLPEARRLKEDYVLAASLLARCIPLVKDDAKTGEHYTRQALDCLRQALERGYSNAKQLQADATLAPLRNHPEFAAIVAKIQGP